MRCDVLAVGTELLLGQIVDTNSAWMGQELAASGIDSLAQVKVGDNVDRIIAQLRRLLEDADAVIVCGGLGPTHDDLTREAIAAVMGTELRQDDDVADVIREMFARRNRPMPENNLRQALVPVGATVIPQTRGTAPGLICPIGARVGAGASAGTGDCGEQRGKVVYAVPGVPHEMQDMVQRAIIPDLLERQGSAAVIASRVLLTWGESESGLDERLRPIIDELDAAENAPTLAFLASGWNGLKVRLTAKAADRAACQAQLDTWDARVRAVLGDIVFGTDDQTMESVVADACRERGLTLAVAESVTGGLITGRLTAVPGVSAVLRGGIVSYASEVKYDLLDVDEGPVVSEVAARQMAEGVRQQLGADIGLAVTGVAGPETQDDMPVGTLFVAVVGPGFDDVRHLNMPGAREPMRQLSVISALDVLRRHLG